MPLASTKAAPPGSGNADPLSLDQKLPLELSNASDQSEHEAAGGGRRVERQIENAEGAPLALQGLDDL